MNNQEKREGQPNEPQDLPSLESQEHDDLSKVLGAKEDGDETVSQANEFQGSTLLNSGASKSYQTIPREVQAESEAQLDKPEVPTDEQCSLKPDNPPDVLRRDLKRIKSAVDDSLNRFSQALNDLLNLDDKDENK